jgi:hypothetical protein
MEMIIISKKRFEELLSTARKDLDLSKFMSKTYIDPDDMVRSMHRAFNYHMCSFAEKIKRE